MKDLLLLLCCYPFEEKNRVTLSKLISEVQDWKKLVRLINEHGIIALAAYNIKEAGLEKELPMETMAFLENGYMQSVVRNTWLTERWKEVNTILSNAGISHILLKGMALEHTLYGAGGLRQMNDNDVLIKREDSVKAWHLLKNDGFTIDTPKSPLHIKIMADISYHLPTLYKEGYSLEIHTKLFENDNTGKTGSYDPFQDPVEISVDNEKAMILKKDDHLKYLIRHFERHALSGECQLRQYADILLLKKGSSVEFPNEFILNPFQPKNNKFRKAAYKKKVRFIQPKYRLLFILGDLFPSIKWMKRRYRCNGFKALLRYPHRLGKLWWLV